MNQNFYNSLFWFTTRYFLLKYHTFLYCLFWKTLFEKERN